MGHQPASSAEALSKAELYSLKRHKIKDAVLVPKLVHWSEIKGELVLENSTRTR